MSFVLKSLIALATCLLAWPGVVLAQAATVPHPALMGHGLSLWLARWLVYLVLFAVGGVLLFGVRWRGSAPGWVRALVAVGLVLLLSAAAVAIGGAAAVAPPRWVSTPLIALHMVAAIAWVGFLLPAGRAIRKNIGPAIAAHADSVPRRARPARSTRNLLRQCTAWSGGAIVLVLASGLGLVLLQMRHPADLLYTDYGNVLLAKLVLVAVLLWLSVRARWVLAAPALQGGLRARTRLRRSVGTQIILAAGILSVVSLWRLAPPAHAVVQAEEPHGPTVSLEDRQVRALVDLPAQPAGPWRIRVISVDGGVLDPLRVVLTLSNPGAGLDPVDHDTVRQPDGRWRVDLPALPAGGQWRIELRIFTSDFDVITLQRDLVLPANLAPQLQPAATMTGTAAAPGTSPPAGAGAVPPLVSPGSSGTRHN